MKRRVTDSAAALAKHLSMPQPPLAAAREPAGLEVCTSCERDFVNPVDWSPLRGDRWWMLLSCGNCGAGREVTVGDSEATRFDRELNLRSLLVAETAHQLDLEQMAVEGERLFEALQRDLIDASDFAR
jgi:hypothetical protein